MFTLTLLVALTPARLPQAPCLRQAELPPRPLSVAQRREIVACVNACMAKQAPPCGMAGCDCGCRQGLPCTCAQAPRRVQPVTYRPAPPMVFSGGFMAGGGGACRGGS